MCKKEIRPPVSYTLDPKQSYRSTHPGRDIRAKGTYPLNAPSQKVGLEDLLLGQGLTALENAESLGNGQTAVHLAYWFSKTSICPVDVV